MGRMILLYFFVLFCFAFLLKCYFWCGGGGLFLFGGGGELWCDFFFYSP